MGLFAARDFKESEVVELAPAFLTFPEFAPVAKNTVLDDYLYSCVLFEYCLG
jgi:hypothetical protein